MSDFAAECVAMQQDGYILSGNVLFALNIRILSAIPCSIRYLNGAGTPGVSLAPAATVVTAPLWQEILVQRLLPVLRRLILLLMSYLTPASGPAVIVASVWTDDTGAWSISERYTD